MIMVYRDCINEINIDTSGLIYPYILVKSVLEMNSAIINNANNIKDSSITIQYVYYKIIDIVYNIICTRNGYLFDK